MERLQRSASGSLAIDAGSTPLKFGIVAFGNRSFRTTGTAIER